MVKCTLSNTDVYFINCYVPPSESLQSFLITLEPFIRRCNDGHLLLVGDFNAKHLTWGGTTEDDRGDLLLEFIISNSLHVINDPLCEPTFETSNGCSWIDLVITSLSLLPFTQNWKVLPEVSCSDHKYITFTLFDSINLTGKKLTNRSRLKLYEFIKEDSWFEVSMADSALSPEIVKIALGVFYSKWSTWQCRLARNVKVSAKRNPWWNDQLFVMRKKLRALRRRYQQCHNQLREVYKHDYYSFLQRYQNEILEAKKLSWRKFCSDSAKANVFGLSYKLASDKIKIPLVIPPVQTLAGDLTNSLSDSIKVILHTLFRQDDVTLDTPCQFALREAASCPPNTLPDSFFTRQEVEGIIKRLPERTTPGLDGIRTTDIRCIWNTHPTFLISVFNSCLKWSYFPSYWRTGKVILLPKPGKPRSEATSYRPICINSIFGKVLERLLLQRLYYFLKTNNLLHPSQFGFTHGVSSTSALAALKEVLLENKQQKIHSLLISLDFQGAFDTLWYPFVLDFLKCHGCPCNLYSLLFQFFQHRSVEYPVIGDSVIHKVSLGCPQGSPLSPLLWNVLLYGLLNLKFPNYVHIQAYADDVVVLISGRSRNDLEDKAKITLQGISNWIKDHRLILNPNKCTCLLVPSGKVFQNRPPIIKLNNINLKFVAEMKILGVVFDRVLSFLPHVKMLKHKVSSLTVKLSAFSGINWGISGLQFRQIYLCCIEKMISYAAPVWWKDENNSHLLRAIVSVQRIPLLRICKAFRSVNNISLPVLCNVLPISLVLSQELKRFQLFVKKRSIQFSGQVINPIDVDFPIDIWTTHPSLRISIPYSKDWIMLQKNKAFHIYTDASLCNLGVTTVGAAFVVFKSGASIIFHKKYKLPSHCSIYLAELWALFKALEFILYYSQYHNWYIFSDSLSALQALQNPISTNSLILRIKDLYARVTNNHTVGLCWVKGHSNNFGNDMADTLANSARHSGELISFPVAPRHIKNILKDHFYNEWNNLWTRDGQSKPLFAWVPSIHSLPTFFPPSYALTQFLTEHGRFPFYLYKRNISPDSFCSCGALISSLSHYLESCPLLSAFQDRFLRYFPNGFSNSPKIKMLNSPDVVKIFEEMVIFINESLQQF